MSHANSRISNNNIRIISRLRHIDHVEVAVELFHFLFFALFCGQLLLLKKLLWFLHLGEPLLLICFEKNLGEWQSLIPTLRFFKRLS